MAHSGHILVTGADGGLGTAVVSRLLDDGWSVAAAIHRPDGIAALENQFSGRPLRVDAADLRLPAGVEQLFAALPPLAGVVHLAGGFTGAKTFGDHQPGDFDKMFHLNTLSTYLIIRAALPLLRAQGGALVTVGARPALHPGGENALYAASKAAVINLTQSAAEEGRKDNIRANVLVPAVIRTEENLRWASSPAEAEKWTPPADIAAVISWLVSEQGASVTGTVIPMYHRLKG